jgi:hypothetical protein
MIIEAGYDMTELLSPRVHATKANRRALWMLAMDDELRKLFITQVCAEYTFPLEQHIPDIVKALECEYGYVTYFVLAHMLPQLGNNIEQTVYNEDEPLQTAPELEGRQFLGRLVFDGEFMYSSAPQFSFRDYPLHDDLPRIAVVKGPHPHLDCQCLACSQFEAKLAANRAMYSPGTVNGKPRISGCHETNSHGHK